MLPFKRDLRECIPLRSMKPQIMAERLIDGKYRYDLIMKLLMANFQSGINSTGGHLRSEGLYDNSAL